MTFRPSLHGWPFDTVPPSSPHVLGGSAPPADGYGTGGGLCWAALDRYLRGTAIPRDLEPPEPGDPLYAELMRRQVDSLSGVWARVREWQGLKRGSWRDRFPIAIAGGSDLASRSRGEWHRIRRSLGRGEPVLLTLLGDTDGYRRSSEAWQVLATACRLEDARVYLSLYDPDRPGDDRVTLAFGAAGPFDARLSDGRSVRGFFAVPYDREVPTHVRAETFGDRSVVGLNRQVRGRVAAGAHGRRLDVVGRGANGALLHFRRERARSWEGVNVTKQEDFGSFELHSDPAVVVAGGRLSVFARSYVGDLLHFRLGRGWSVRNCTDQKRAGARFRIVGVPVPVEARWGQINVLGRDKDGGLVHYASQPLVGWRAEQVAGDPLASDPVAARAGELLHVAGAAPDGRPLYWGWDGSEWTPLDLNDASGTTELFRLAAAPALRAREDAVQVAGRTKDGRLVVYERDPEGEWSVAALATGVLGDPVLTDGPAGAHVFARTEAGIAHGWRGREWEAEELLETRPSLPTPPLADSLAAWGTADELRVWSRSEGDLWTLIWRPDCDWCYEALGERIGVADRHLPASDPVVVEDSKGQPHLFGTDGRGTIVHAEPGEWRKPEEEAAKRLGTAAQARAARAEARRKQAALAGSRTTSPPARPEPKPAPKPAPKPEPEPEPLPLLEDPAWEGPKEDAPAEREHERESVEAEATEVAADDDLPFLDFEADPAPPATPLRPTPDAVAPAGETADEEEAEEFEPMDLSLLDSWPDAPVLPSDQPERRPEGREREAS